MPSPLRTYLNTKDTPLSLNLRTRTPRRRRSRRTDIDPALLSSSTTVNTTNPIPRPEPRSGRIGTFTVYNKAISAKTAPHRFDNTTGNRYSDKVTR